MTIKLCKDCVHYKKPDGCYSPHNGFNMINGKTKLVYAIDSRSGEGNLYCGKEGKFFERKKSLLERLFISRDSIFK